MQLQATTCAATRIAIVAMGVRSRFTSREVDREEYLEWFERVGRPHLFAAELREGQYDMLFAEDWPR